MVSFSQFGHVFGTVAGRKGKGCVLQSVAAYDGLSFMTPLAVSQLFSWADQKKDKIDNVQNTHQDLGPFGSD